MLRRVCVAACAATALLLTAMAGPALAKPAGVAPPWVKASSTTSITLDWVGSKGAARYEVLYSTSYAGAMSSSAKSRKTSGNQSELKITGLKPATMYCFTVRGLAGSSKGSRAARHCKFTMRRENVRTLPTARVATYNICSAAGGCADTWESRKQAIVDRISDTAADVLALQESSGRIDDMQAALQPLGYALGSRVCGSEAVFYRTAVFEQVDPLGPPVTKNGCRDKTRQPQTGGGGSFYLANEADAAWARLVHRSTGLVYVFVSAHLTTGDSTTAEKSREVESRYLVQSIRNLTPAMSTRRVIIAGDFNSHRNRNNDTPRRILNAAGWHDTYDRSATFVNPRYNSYTGYGTTPKTSNTYGDHVDHVFVQDPVGSTNWRVHQRFVNGRYATPVPSDHSPVGVTLFLP